MKKCLLILPLILFCHITFGDMEEDLNRILKEVEEDTKEIQIPFTLVQKNEYGKLTINRVYTHGGSSYVKADGTYENTTNSIFSEVSIIATAFNYEGTIIGNEKEFLFDSSYGPIRPGMKIKLEFLLRLKEVKAKKVKNIVFSFLVCRKR